MCIDAIALEIIIVMDAFVKAAEGDRKRPVEGAIPSTRRAVYSLLRGIL
jgi:hypothetical protein